jgi:uncharacterized protein (DUF1778 family)
VSATARLEVRVRPEVKARIEHAAELARVPVSDFVRSAAEERAELVLAEHQTQTRVPAEFFDALLDAPDTEPRPDPALAAAAARARDLLRR